MKETCFKQNRNWRLIFWFGGFCFCFWIELQVAGIWVLDSSSLARPRFNLRPTFINVLLGLDGALGDILHKADQFILLQDGGQGRDAPFPPHVLPLDDLTQDYKGVRHLTSGAGSKQLGNLRKQQGKSEQISGITCSQTKPLHIATWGWGVVIQIQITVFS